MRGRLRLRSASLARLCKNAMRPSPRHCFARLGGCCFCIRLVWRKVLPTSPPVPLALIKGQGGGAWCRTKTAKKKTAEAVFFLSLLVQVKQGQTDVYNNAVWGCALLTYEPYSHRQALDKSRACIRSYTTHYYNSIKPPICQE